MSGVVVSQTKSFPAYDQGTIWSFAIRAIETGDLLMGRNPCSFQGSLGQVVDGSVAEVTALAIVTTKTRVPRLSTSDPQSKH